MVNFIQFEIALQYPVRWNVYLSYDVTSGIEITPCNKIDKPLAVYRFTGKRYDAHNNVAIIMTKLWRFYARNEISKYLSYDKYNLTFVLLYYWIY